MKVFIPFFLALWVSLALGNTACDNSAAPENEDCSATKNKYKDLDITKWGKTYKNTQYLYCGVNRANCKNVCNRGEISAADIKTILDKHNELRRSVAKGLVKGKDGKSLPQAADMYELTWDEDLAAGAQLWADQCPSGHDDNQATPDFPRYVGQNMYWGANSRYSATYDYEAPILSWFKEVKDWPVNNNNPYTQDGKTGVVGHFTAIAWAATTKVGCGSIGYYDGQWYSQRIVCNYGVGGNMMGGVMYTSGAPGSKCGLKGSNDGLCIA